MARATLTGTIPPTAVVPRTMNPNAIDDGITSATGAAATRKIVNPHATDTASTSAIPAAAVPGTVAETVSRAVGLATTATTGCAETNRKPALIGAHPEEAQANPTVAVSNGTISNGASVGPTKNTIANVAWPARHLPRPTRTRCPACPCAVCPPRPQLALEVPGCFPSSPRQMSLGFFPPERVHRPHPRPLLVTSATGMACHCPHCPARPVARLGFPMFRFLAPSPRRGSPFRSTPIHRPCSIPCRVCYPHRRHPPPDVPTFPSPDSTTRFPLRAWRTSRRLSPNSTRPRQFGWTRSGPPLPPLPRPFSLKIRPRGRLRPLPPLPPRSSQSRRPSDRVTAPDTQTSNTLLGRFFYPRRPSRGRRARQRPRPRRRRRHFFLPRRAMAARPPLWFPGRRSRRSVPPPPRHPSLVRPPAVPACQLPSPHSFLNLLQGFYTHDERSHSQQQQQQQQQSARHEAGGAERRC
jgi:hypothetical protein